MAKLVDAPNGPGKGLLYMGNVGGSIPLVKHSAYRAGSSPAFCTILSRGGGTITL